MKKIKILTILLAIVLISMVAFFGIYVQVQNRMENKVKGYSYAMDLSGGRMVVLKVNEGTKTVIKDENGNEVSNSSDLTDDEIAEKGYTKEEVPNNLEDVLTVENYKKSKEIIEKRLKKLNVQNYIVKLDETTGDIIIEIEENDDTDFIVSGLNTMGKFEIVDSQTSEVLMNNSDIKLSNVLYGNNSTTTTNNGTSVYLNIEFTREGAKKLENISNEYVTVEDSSESEETESQETDTEENTQKEITMKVDDDVILTTSFSEPLRTGKLQLTVGQATTDENTLKGYIEQASSMATVLDTGNIPVKYDIDENEYVSSDITRNELHIVKYVFAVATLIAAVALCIRYKSNGIVSGISYIGLFAILMLLIRYANVVLSIEGLFAIGLTLILEYMFINKILNKMKKESINEAVKESYKEFFIRLIPLFIAIITFCFIKWIPISSFGMVMFWEITLIAIYNFVVVSNLLKIKVQIK